MQFTKWGWREVKEEEVNALSSRWRTQDVSICVCDQFRQPMHTDNSRFEWQFASH